MHSPVKYFLSDLNYLLKEFTHKGLSTVDVMCCLKSTANRLADNLMFVADEQGLKGNLEFRKALAEMISRYRDVEKATDYEMAGAMYLMADAVSETCRKNLEAEMNEDFR